MPHTDRRRQAKKLGLCTQCAVRASLPQRHTCATCLMRAIAKEAFKSQRKRPGGAARLGGCYSTGYDRAWIDAVVGKFDGRCFYTGWAIEIGATAGLDHKLPRSRASTWGERHVYCPENLVWCHQGINALKGDQTATEFIEWMQAHPWAPPRTAREQLA